ncbi:MAG: hypothetical protein WBL05_13925 [Brooklawnia sp.]|uniref:hypothetical protein n=1 Tax=Brooklawnia sp. TaxID=2699740 RepID=UPI003C74A254
MAIYLSTLLLIVLAALGLLAAVALAAIGEEHGDGTRLTGRLRIMMKHLNGDAAAPKQVAQFFASATRTHERADAERSGSASDTVAPRPATADATTAEQHTARHRVRGDGLAA